MFTKPKRTVTKVYIHCSASDNPSHDNIATIKQWHLARGFNDIGYHYYINKAGSVLQGRPLERIPAAQEGHNAGSLAICLGGLASFTQEQFKSLRNLCVEIKAKIPGVTFHGHCEVSAKSCPVFDYKTVLKLDAKGNLQ